MDIDTLSQTKRGDTSSLCKIQDSMWHGKSQQECHEHRECLAVRNLLAFKAGSVAASECNISVQYLPQVALLSSLAYKSVTFLASYWMGIEKFLGHSVCLRSPYDTNCVRNLSMLMGFLAYSPLVFCLFFNILMQKEVEGSSTSHLINVCQSFPQLSYLASTLESLSLSTQ